MRSNTHISPEWRPVSDILGLIGDKWTVVVVGELGEQRLRFNELKRRIKGISQKMLASKLRTLERDGLVLRTFYPVIPPRVEYELTELGRQLLSPLAGLAEFALMHQIQVDMARRRFDDGLEEADMPPPILPSRAALRR